MRPQIIPPPRFALYPVLKRSRASGGGKSRTNQSDRTLIPRVIRYIVIT